MIGGRFTPYSSWGDWLHAHINKQTNKRMSDTQHMGTTRTTSRSDRLHSALSRPVLVRYLHSLIPYSPHVHCHPRWTLKQCFFRILTHLCPFLNRPSDETWKRSATPLSDSRTFVRLFRSASKITIKTKWTVWSCNRSTTYSTSRHTYENCTFKYVVERT